MKTIFAILFALTLTANATTLVWTNTVGGSWLAPANWSPNAAPGSSDTIYITNSGTYQVILTNPSPVTVLNLFIGGASGTQTLVLDNGVVLNPTLNWQVRSNGVLEATNGWLQGTLNVQPGGQLQLVGPATKFLYSVTLLNQGTVAWSGGALEFGGTVVSNGGLWQMTSDDQIAYGGGSTPVWTNSGTFRKSNGPGTSYIGGVNFFNQPGGLVDAASGTILFAGGSAAFNGTFNAIAPAQISFFNGTWTDAGGTATGTGTIQFTSGTLNLRTNPVPGLKLTGGDIYITNTFQQAGAITNLTLDGATLHGTNSIGAGALTFNSGSVVDQLTVLPAGQLLLATSTTKLLYSLNLINQGTVLWSGGGLNVGSTIISNGGLWQITSDNSIAYGGYNSPVWTNSGTLRKTAGTGTSGFSGLSLVNQSNGLIQADSGILELPANYTNTAGTLRLNGGTLQAGFSTALTLAGGTLDGTGTLGANLLAGGTISPGFSPGLIQFKSGLNFGPGATLVIEGTGTIPGAGYDQLSVTGAVAISNCTLQVTSLPVVPFGTTFTIIQNDGSDAVQGAFAGLPENSLINASGQNFRLHYAGGDGNDVTLVNESGTPPVGPKLSNGSYLNGTFQLLGAGSNSTIYEIQATTNFLQWTNIGAVTGGAGGGFNFVDTNASKFRYRFYRTTN